MNSLLNKLRTPITFFCIGVLFSCLIFGLYLNKTKSDPKESEIIITKKESQPLKYYVNGAVESPNVIEVLSSDVLTELKSKIPFSENADKDNFFNSFTECPDCLVLWVPYKETSTVVLGEQISTTETSNVCVNLNTASQSELESLPGIGATYAQRIIEGRPYSQKSDLKNVKGIGDKTYQKIESLICL